MSTKENNDVAVEKATENDKACAEPKCEIKGGIKRAAEVSFYYYYYYYFYNNSLHLWVFFSFRGSPTPSTHHNSRILYRVFSCIVSLCVRFA